MRQEHPFQLKITIEGAQGHGKTTAVNAIRAALNSEGACVTVKDHDGSDDNGEFRHSMSDAWARCAAYPLAQTMVWITTKYSK